MINMRWEESKRRFKVNDIGYLVIWASCVERHGSFLFYSIKSKNGDNSLIGRLSVS